MNIGWVGLGDIGTQMVLRALAAGFELTVYERGQGLAEVLAAGARGCSDYRELARQSDLLVLCVYSDEQVSDLLWQRGALAALQAGSVVMSHVTGSPALVRKIQAEAPGGVAVLDATFSGGPATVAEGKLTVMVGGDVAVGERVAALLGTYADQVHHVGELGQAQWLKLFNNLLFAVNLMNAAEVLKQGGDLGFQSSHAAHILKSCSGGSYAMDLFQADAPVDTLLLAAGPYLAKDVKTALSVAAEMGLDLARFSDVAEYFKPLGPS